MKLQICIVKTELQKALKIEIHLGIISRKLYYLYFITPCADAFIFMSDVGFALVVFDFLQNG